MAQDLSLHFIDHPGTFFDPGVSFSVWLSSKGIKGENPVEKSMNRRRNEP
jgi:hypothetical protein